MLKTKNHERDFFYKYFDFNGAKLTLENGNFLYKAPAFFNDPFDSQLVLQPGISEQEIRDIFFKLIADSIIEKRPAPRLGLLEKDLPKLSHLTKKDLGNVKEQLLSRLPKNIFTESHQQAAEMLLENFKDNFVFCVTEKYDNLLMWSHYADQHKGVVFKIKCLDEKESLLCAALKVNYQDKYPILGNFESWTEFIATGELRQLDKSYIELVTTKSNEWRYEDEWRVVFPIPEDGGKEFTLLKFHPEEIDCIFLGCRMYAENKLILNSLIKKHYPWVKIFQATKSVTNFELHFTELKI